MKFYSLKNFFPSSGTGKLITMCFSHMLEYSVNLKSSLCVKYIDIYL